MDDETAYMELVTSNAQGELLPLEIGLHSDETVESAQGIKGDGIAAYAKAIGKSETSVKEWRSAGRVYKSLRRTCDEVQNKPRHLYEISKAPESTWQTLVGY